MHNLHGRLVILTLAVGVMLDASSARLRAAEPPARERPIREIFVPFEDLDVLLDGDAHRVFLERAEYEDLIAKAKTSPADETPRDWLTLAADYQVVINDGRVTIEATIDLEVFSQGLFAIPLTLNNVGIRHAKLNADMASLGRDDQGGVRLFVEGKGQHRLTLDLVTPLETSAAQQSLKFELPTPPSRRLRLTVPGNVEVRSGAAVSSRTVDAEANVTRFELLPPRGPLALTMSLNNRTLRQQRVVMARSVMVDEVTQAYERLHATFSMGVLHGAVEQFQFEVPPGFEVSAVTSPLLSRWEVIPAAEEGGAPTLEVTLREPTNEIVVLNLSATATSPSMDAWSMPRFEPLDVNNHVAVVGLLVEDRLAVEGIAAKGLIPIDNGVLRSRLPASVFNAEPGAPQVRSVVVYYAPQSAFTLSARFTRPPAQTNVTSHVLLLLNERQKTVRGGFSLQAEAEKIFAVDLRIPAGWTVTKVATQEGADLPRESFALPDGDTRMRVRLPQGVPLGERFDLVFDATSTPAGWLEEWSEREILFPVFSVMDAAHDNGAIAVQPAEDLVVRPLAIDGLIPLDEAEKAAFGLEASPTSLAYQYAAQPYSATINVRRGQPRATAQTFSFFRIEPDGLSAHYELLFDIRQARTKQLTFELPADTPAAISVRGLDGVRVKEYNSEIADDRRQWTVLLADGQAGGVRLAVDFSQPLSEGEPRNWDLPVIKARDVVYQTAMVAVEGNSEFDIKLQTAGRKIDVGELVAADYQVGRRLLGAFGFVGMEPRVLVDVFRRSAYGLPSAIVQRVEFVTLVSSSGRSQTAARYHLRTKATYLQVELPDPQQTKLWSATLDGVPSTPQRDGGSLLISLPPKAGQAIRNLQLVYESPHEGFAVMGEIEVLAPKLFVRGENEGTRYMVPVADLTWDLVLPNGHRILRTGGSVFETTVARRRSPLAVVAATAWKLSGGLAGPWFLMSQKMQPAASLRGDVSGQVSDMEMSADGLEFGAEMEGATPFFEGRAATEKADELADRLDAAPADPFAAMPPTNEPAPPEPALAAPAPAAAPAEAPASAPTAAAGLQVQSLSATRDARSSQVADPDGVPGRGQYWALEGVRSLQIDLHQRGHLVSFQSMGAAPVLRATLVDQNRLGFLSYAVAMLVVLIGVGLSRQGPKRKARFVLEVALAALILPLVIGWISGLDVGPTFDNAFYAACLVAVYYVVLAVVKSVTDAALSMGRANRPTAASEPSTGASSGGVQSTTVTSLVLFLATVSGVGEPSASQAIAQTQPSLPATTPLTPAGLADLLQPPPPIKLPAEAVIIPYDADDADGLKNAQRVLVPFDEYARLWNLAFPQQPIDRRTPPARFALAGGRYQTVLVDDDQLTINGHLDLDLFVEEPVAIPLPLQRAVLARATLDGDVARIQVVTANPAGNQPPAAAKSQQAKRPASPGAESFVVVHAQGQGRHRLELSIRLRLDRSGGWRQVDGVIPIAPSTQLELTVPAAETEVRLSNVADQSSFETSRDGEQFATALNAVGNLQLQWRPKVGAGEVDQSLTVQSAAVFDIQEDGLRMAWQLNLQFRTQRETFTIQLPAEYLVEKVTGENVRGWTTKLADNTQQLDVTLLKATTGSELMTLYFSRRDAVGQGGLVEFGVPVAAVPDAVQHQGHVTIRRSPLLAVETRSTVGVSRTDPTPASQAVIAAVDEESPLGIRPYQDFRFVTTPYTIDLSATPLADPASTPLIEQTGASLQTLLRIGARETSYESKVAIQVKQRPVHQVRLLLPIGFELDRVDAPGVFEQSTITDAGREQLTIYLAEGQAAPFSVLLGGHVRRAAAESDVPLPRIDVLDVGEQQGYVAIQADPAFRVTLRDLTNCQIVPLTRVEAWLNPEQRSHADLAVSYRSRDYSANLRTETVLPETHASTITNVRVTTRQIEETVLLRFTIEKAGIRGVVFRLPARMRDARITAPMLRQTTIEDLDGDTESIRVSLELQDDKMGELIVVVQNDVALSGTQHEAPVPVVETGLSQDRYVVLENAGRDEVVVRDALGMEALRRDQAKWATLAQVLDNKMTQAFVITDDVPPRLTYTTKRRDVVDTAGAAIRLAQATLVVDGSGTYRAVQEYRVDNKTEQFLEIELPTGAQLWTVRVAGEPVKPTEVPAAGGQVDLRQLRIPLIKTAAGDLDYPVEIKYGGQLGAFSLLRRVDFPLVKTKRIQVELSHVRLHLPETHQFIRFDGTMKRVYDEGDLAAGFLAYRNRQIEQLRQVMSGQRGVFSKMRAANNLKQLGLAMQNYQETYRRFNANDQFQIELNNNNAVWAEANRQLQTQEQELLSEAVLDNRERLLSAYKSQKAGKASNIVNNLGSNFFTPGVNLDSNPSASDGTGAFNSRWLDENKFAVQELGKRGKQLDRITAGRNMVRESDVTDKKQVAGQQVEMQNPKFRIDAEIPADRGSDSARQSNELGEQIQRYRSQLADQSQLQSLPQAVPQAERAAQTFEQAAGEPAGMAGGIGGGGFGGGGAGFGRQPNQQGIRSGNRNAQPAPTSGSRFGLDSGAVFAQGQNDPAAHFDDQPDREFVLDGAALGLGSGDAGLASLDVELPVRGGVYLFTTPRGDTRITVQAVSKKQVRRWEQLGGILGCLTVLGILGWCAVRAAQLVSHRFRAIMLVVLGIASLVMGIMPVLGLVVMVWGAGALVLKLRHVAA